LYGFHWESSNEGYIGRAAHMLDPRVSIGGPRGGEAISPIVPVKNGIIDEASRKGAPQLKISHEFMGLLL
jgi:hypothetical protein